MKDSAKRLVFLLYRHPGLHLRGFRDGAGKETDHANLEILRRLRKKGYVDMEHTSDGMVYHLTNEGRKFAASMINEAENNHSSGWFRGYSIALS